MTHHSSKLLLSFLCLALAAATTASAGTRSRSAEGPRGSATRTVEREPGRTHREITVANHRGQTATREVDRTWDRETRTATVSVEATGPNGRTASREGTFQKAGDGHTRTAIRTGPNGNTATKEIDVSRSGDSVTRTRTTTRTSGSE